jgi:DNA repair exonuclease SbcCD ATPase subunit
MKRAELETMVRSALEPIEHDLAELEKRIQTRQAQQRERQQLAEILGGLAERVERLEDKHDIRRPYTNGHDAESDWEGAL